MTVYADILFATNLIVNYLIILLSAKAIKLPPKRFRFLLAAAIGAVGAFELLLPSVPIYISIPAKAALCAVMTLTAHGKLKRRLFMKALASLLLISFALGGALSALLTVIHPRNICASLMGVYIDISPLVLILLTVVSYITVALCERVSSRVRAKNHTYTVNITCPDSVITCRALLDTGSTLHDVFTGDPVIVVSPDLIDIPLQNLNGYRCIPYNTVGERGVLEAFRPIKVEVEADGRRVKYEKITVAKSAHPLQNGYGALLPSDMAAVF